MANAAADDPEVAHFLEGIARKEFLLRYDPSTGRYHEPQAELDDDDAPLSWKRASGGAKIVSWTVEHRRDGEGRAFLTVLAIAELDEGPWWWAKLVDCDAASLRVGQRVVIDFQQAGSDRLIPVFRLDEARAG